MAGHGGMVWAVYDNLMVVLKIWFVRSMWMMSDCRTGRFFGMYYHLYSAIGSTAPDLANAAGNVMMQCIVVCSNCVQQPSCPVVCRLTWRHIVKHATSSRYVSSR